MTAPLASSGATPVFKASNAYSRRLVMFDKLSAEQTPALYQVQVGEMPKKETGKPPLLALMVDWVVVTDTGGNPNLIPSTVFNPILDALEACLIPKPGYSRQNLGGLVYDARWTGRVLTTEGTLGTRAINIMEIEVMVPEGFFK
jgi:hypothetical protein